MSGLKAVAGQDDYLCAAQICDIGTIADDLSNALQPSWGVTSLKHSPALPPIRIRLKFEPVLAMDFQAGEAIASNNL